MEVTEENNPFRVFDGEVEKILERMLELAGADKSEYGKRKPGEKCKYEQNQGNPVERGMYEVGRSLDRP